ncbi:Trk K+ transport system NAD-binding subunit [Streptomyces olivoverticillatus]|uniref:Trk K+ transport system NAD-binding subunit n=2 Tax=Streptomyces olivoverticillatus TaxID=66427 RepID=A0A7W7LU46_9ACTN|nr:Trk K+ transport system NAD-binding subunit [Streptomyces olivoverticillatus]
MVSLPQQPQGAPVTPHMVVCGDDGLVHRLAAELSGVYGERVTLVLPPARDDRRRSVSAAQGRAAALFGRVTGAVGRGGPAAGQNGTAPGPLVSIVEAAEPDDEALAAAGIDRAAALALVYDDDETNIHAALRARRVNPRLRLVIRLYNRRLGQYLEQLLDQAALVGAADGPDGARAAADASTTVLSDADTAAPALVAAAVAGTSKVVEAGGLLLRAAERPPPPDGAAPEPGTCTLALLSDGDGPELLPDERTVARAAGRGRLVLETVRYSAPPRPPSRLAVARSLPLGSFFSRRLRWALAGLAAAVCGLAVASWLVTGDDPVHAAYLSLLDLFAIDDPAIGQPLGRQILQLLSGLLGLLLLPLLVAAALEGLGTFRSASALPRPPRGMSGHVVLLGLGKVGARVLARLRELNIPVVCVERDPQARGVALARSLRVPTVIGDVTEEGVLEAAKIADSRTLLALTSSDTTNLEAVLYARAVKPDVRVVMRLYEDRFANAVYRTLRDSQPQASTRSRSVSYLVAPAFAGAMMGRQILGAVPVERKVILFASVEVAGHGALEGRTAAEAFRPGAWRVLALDLDSGPGLLWPLPAEHVFGREDRVIVVATREGLADLLGRRPRPRTADGERPFGAAR